MARIFYRSHPAFAASLSTSSKRANQEYEEIARLAENGRIFLIAPSRAMEVSRLEGDMEKLGELYSLGYEDGKAAVPALKSYLDL